MTRRIARAILAAGLLFLPQMAAAACRDLTHDGQSHIICEVSAGQDLRLFLNGPDGTVLGTFGRIDAMLATEGRRLVMAMNAGMYHADRRPVGLYVENGVQGAPLVTAEGPGNFGLLPNGVFCIRPDGRFAVIESRRFGTTACRFATQSGPMLVIDGALHPRFLPDSASRYVRNGVGVSADGTRAVLAISRARVTFHEFARLFRDALDLPQALYFDGNISRLYAPDMRRNDFGFPMGPVIGLVAGD